DEQRLGRNERGCALEMQATVQRQRLHGIAEGFQRLAELCDSGGVGASARPSGEADVELAADAQHVPALEAGRVAQAPHLEMPGERCGDGFDLAATRARPWPPDAGTRTVPQPRAAARRASAGWRPPESRSI